MKRDILKKKIKNLNIIIDLYKKIWLLRFFAINVFKDYY